MFLLSRNSNFDFKKSLFLLVSHNVTVSEVEKISRSKIFFFESFSSMHCFKFDRFDHEKKFLVYCAQNDHKKKHSEGTLKTKYEALKELGKINLKKKLAFSSSFLEVHLLSGKSKDKSTKLFKIDQYNDKDQSGNI